MLQLRWVSIPALYLGGFRFGSQRSSYPEAFMVSLRAHRKIRGISTQHKTTSFHGLSISQSYYCSSYITYAVEECH
jgi:hypothetical protein